MRCRWRAIGWVGVVLLILASCRTPRPDLKPPPEPESYQLPPMTDQRFSKHVEFPKQLLEQGEIATVGREVRPQFPIGRGGMGPMGGPMQ